MEGRTDNSNPSDNKSKFSVHRCVVCNGFGTLKYGSKTCQACKGKGFVVIDNSTGFAVEE